jgi:hypothetical protein
VIKLKLSRSSPELTVRIALGSDSRWFHTGGRNGKKGWRPSGGREKLQPSIALASFLQRPSMSWNTDISEIEKGTWKYLD